MSAVLPLFKTKRCPKCKKDLELSAFSVDRNKANGLKSYCRSCLAIEWGKYKATPEGKATVIKKRRVYRSTVKGKAHVLYDSARKRAVKKNLEFSITREWIHAKLIIGKCELSGLLFDLSLSKDTRTHPYGPSIDRIDSRRGYTEDNCRIICWALNLAFNQWGEVTFTEIVKAYLEKNKLR